MITAFSIGFALRRALSSLAAIIAISAIFGAKALESEQLAGPLSADLAVADWTEPVPHTR
jgi:hypothetical protein